MSTQTLTDQPKSQLNPRQAKVIKKIIEGKPASVAYAEVYPVKNSNVAGVGAHDLLNNPKVQNALQIALRKHGINEESIAESLGKINESWDWKAKDAFVKHAGRFLGYDQEQGAPIAQVGNIVNNWKVGK